MLTTPKPGDVLQLYLVVMKVNAVLICEAPCGGQEEGAGLVTFFGIVLLINRYNRTNHNIFSKEVYLVISEILILENKISSLLNFLFRSYVKSVS